MTEWSLLLQNKLLTYDMISKPWIYSQRFKSDL